MVNVISVMVYVGSEDWRVNVFGLASGVSVTSWLVVNAVEACSHFPFAG